MPLRGWHAAVVASAAIVTLVLIAMGIDWLVSLRSSTTVEPPVKAPLRGVELTIDSGQAMIVGTDASTLQVRRTDHYSFGHAARERRSLSHGVLRISSSCPKIVVGSCSASYELAVPETVALVVHTGDGDVRLDGFRGSANVHTGAGNVTVEAYCGFDLAAVTGSGDVRITTACSPRDLEIHTGSGNATALVPPGRYRISLASGAGQPHVSGLVQDPKAPFTISMHSGSGDVRLGGGL
jgi:DUF4097 and DUF4098 domain-containing protein YvlB